MATKVKGLIKGIKNISSQIFDDEKEKEEEEEIQIGGPTDVKHLAHIGSDASTATEYPSWMKGFDPSKESQCRPLDKTGASVSAGDRIARRNGAIHRSSRSVETSTDVPLLPRASRNRRRSMDHNTLHSESQDKTTRHPRRHQSEGRTRSQIKILGEDSKNIAPRRSTRRRHKTNDESSSDQGPTRSPTKSRTDESDVGSDVV